MNQPYDIAIVGIGGVFPGAADLEAFWRNVRAGRSAAKEAPGGRWLLSPDEAVSSKVEPDRVLSKRACFIEDFQFDPSRFTEDRELGELLGRLDLMFHLLLHAGKMAWDDAATAALDRGRVGIIIGNIVLPTDASSRIADEVLGPHFDSALRSRGVFVAREDAARRTEPLNRYVAGLPAGVLAHVLGLGRGTFTLDAACASSLYALKLACDELTAGRADAMLAGGLSRPDSLYTQMGFSQLKALSPSGRCAPFDAQADGLVVGEGCGIFVLKRRADALRDGDRIYAIVRGAGLSNDIAGNLMLPDSEGQLRAMRDAYAQAGWSPRDVQLIECHGTGTPTGDAVELASLRTLLGDATHPMPPSDPVPVIGSVKSNVGHLLTGAGAAGLMKVLFAMRDGVLPPTANFDAAAPRLLEAGKTIRVLNSPQEWKRQGAQPRRAAISGFGFGGINAHVLIEEWTGETRATAAVALPTPHQTQHDEAVAIVGLDAQFGSLDSLGAFRRAALQAPIARATSHRKTIDEVAVPIGRFAIPPAELRDMLPQQLLMLQTAADAVADAGIREDASHLRTGVFIGIGLDLCTTNFHFRWSVRRIAARWAFIAGLHLSNHQFDDWVAHLRDAASPPLSANRTMGALGGIVASRVARALKVGGPSFTISAEEASGLKAVEVAVRSLRRGEIDTAIVGAVDFASEERTAVSTNAARGIDTQFGDGAAAIVLKRRADALRDGDRIYAVIREVESWSEAVAPVIETANNEYLNTILRSPGPSITDAIGDCGAATGLAALVRGALALHHDTLPAEVGAQHWLRDRSAGPRGAAAHAGSVDGNRCRVVLEEAMKSRSAGLDEAERAIIAHAATTPAHDGVRGGKVAFVYPGAGNQYLGMCRSIAVRWPQVMRKQDAENGRLASQFARGRFWTANSVDEISHRDVIFGQVCAGTIVTDLLAEFGVRPDAVIGYSLGETTSLFSTRIWPAAARDEMLRRMDESPLFVSDLAGPCDAARNAWGLRVNEPVDWLVGIVPAPREKVEAVMAGRSRVYLLIVNTPSECVIGGDRAAVLALARDLRCALHPVEGVTTVHCEVIDPVKEKYRRLHLLEVERAEAQARPAVYSSAWGKAYEVTRESAAESILAQASGTVDFTRVIEAAYADGVRIFLETGPGESCTRMIRQILADRPHLALAACTSAEHEVEDVLRTLGRLQAAGVNVTLGEQPSQPTKATGRPQVVRVRTGAPTFDPRRFALPPRGANAVTAGAADASEAETSIETQEMAMQSEVAVSAGKAEFNIVSDAEAAVASQPVLLDARSISPLVSQMASTQVACAEAQSAFLATGESLNDSVARLMRFQVSLAGLSGGDESVASMPVIDEPHCPKRHAAEAPVVFDRDMCMEFAIGSIARMLGPAFAPIDAHPTRVRLPDEPLMLVDRITELEGEPASMTHGRVVTEHDIHPGAWYLDCGRIPTCIAVEAGQADLFLSGYLGIDFITKGLAVYRLLDAVVTFHAPLPSPGETIRYDIRVNEFFRQGDTNLFRFEFDATVNGEPVLTMRRGCAGFFTEAELAAGKGIVQTAIDTKPMPGVITGGWQWLAPRPAATESYTDDQLNALRRGDERSLSDCFGDAFAPLAAQQPVGLPSGRMTLVHRILALDAEGGRFGLGQITGEADIHPDDWFLTCHFIDDRVMPGTLMYECCLHTLRVLLLRMGFVGEGGEVAYEPIPGVAGHLKCRGQVTEATKKVQYEITVKEIGYGGRQRGTEARRHEGEEAGETTPYVIADALMYADGRPVVAMKDMSLRLSGLTKEKLEARWAAARESLALPLVLREASEAAPLSSRPAIFDFASIYAFANGNPSEAFGDRYKVFDHDRRIARLPRPPYQFLDRIVSIEGCEQWKLAAGGVIEAEYDVPAGVVEGGQGIDPVDQRNPGWYFASNRQRTMPFAVLLEVALQPCGWLAAYLGSALTSDVDLKFRNLGGSATQLREVTPDSGTLTTRIKITRVSQSAGMIIQNFDMRVRDAHGEVYRGDTYFGFFSAEALRDQVGIRDAKLYAPGDAERARSLPAFDLPDAAPLPDAQMRMLDRVDHFDPAGGPHGLGFIEGSTRVNPGNWFFQAHFHQDPVWPGSLGLESFIQLLKVVAMQRWGSDPMTQFESPALGAKHTWIYRGQILPTDERVTVQAVVTKLDDASRTITADGFLSVDGRTIYQMKDFTLREH